MAQFGLLLGWGAFGLRYGNIWQHERRSKIVADYQRSWRLAWSKDYDLRQSKPSVIAHCDWSLSASKRWMAIAVRERHQWKVFSPEQVGEVGTLIRRLSDRSQEPGPIFLGFDFPIGLPECYGEKTGASNFKEALTWFGGQGWEDWFTVCETAEEISIHRPFYPMRPGGTKRSHLVDGLSVTDTGVLLRRCERATGTRPSACILFWTLGGNQVGKAAISGWQEFIKPNLGSIALWPFDGPVREAFATADIVVAETYPGDVYAQIDLPNKSEWSKRSTEGRAYVAPQIRHWFQTRPTLVTDRLIQDVGAGFGTTPSGEDQFDALVGLLGMIDVTEGLLPEGAPDDLPVTRWEGWILGQAP